MKNILETLLLLLFIFGCDLTEECKLQYKEIEKIEYKIIIKTIKLEGRYFRATGIDPLSKKSIYIIEDTMVGRKIESSGFEELFDKISIGDTIIKPKNKYQYEVHKNNAVHYFVGTDCGKDGINIIYYKK